MAAPNIVNITSLLGKSSATNLTTTSATSILNNPVSSGRVLRVLSVRVANVDGSSAASVTVSYHSEDDIGGTAYPLVQLKEVAINTSYEAVTRENSIYLEEDRSLSASASTADDLTVIVTYEEIS